MRKITFLFALVAPLFWNVQAQQTFSFEASEGFTLGNINGQSGWQSTVDGNGIFPTTQTISNEQSSVGDYSLRLSKDNAYGTNYDPFFGAIYNFAEPVSTANMSFSADIYMTESSFTSMSVAFGIMYFDSVTNEPRYRTRFNLAYDRNTDVFVLGNTPGSFIKKATTFKWQLNTWHTIKIVTQGSNVSFYADGVFLISEQLITSGNVEQLSFRHDNYNGVAYVDNVKIESTLSTEKFNVNEITHFYNKNLDQLVLNSTENPFSNVSVYNLLGQNVIAKTLNNNKETLDFSKLSSGVYLVEVMLGTTSKTFKVLKN